MKGILEMEGEGDRARQKEVNVVIRGGGGSATIDGRQLVTVEIRQDIHKVGIHTVMYSSMEAGGAPANLQIAEFRAVFGKKNILDYFLKGFSNGPSCLPPNWLCAPNSKIWPFWKWNKFFL